MKFSIAVGPEKQHRIEYSRNCFTGKERLLADGNLIAERRYGRSSNFVSVAFPLSFALSFGDSLRITIESKFPLMRRCEFTLGDSPSLRVVFDKVRPIFLAGFRPHQYRVMVDDVMVHYQKGF